MKATIFFISDIHLSDARAENEGLVINAFFEDFEKQLQTIASPEVFVLLGGDLVADADKPGAYDAFYEHFIKPMIHLGIKKKNIICVPGNHDVQRSWIKDKMTVYAPVVSQTFTEESFNDLIGDNLSSVLLEKFRNYYTFMLSTMEHNEYNCNLVGYPEELNPEWSVYCLNSSLTTFAGIEDTKYATLKNDERHLNIDTRRLREWVQSNKKKKILLMHHPLEYYTPWANVELLKIIKSSFDLVLSGHTHDQDLLCNSNGSDSYVWCKAPQLFTDKHETLGYSIIQLDKCGVERIIYREWSPRREIFRPGLSFTEEDNGIVDLNQHKFDIKDKVTVLFEDRLNDTLAVYGNKSLVWLDRFFSTERFDRVFTFKKDKLFSEDDFLNEEPAAIKIITPAQYGLTSFAWHFLLRLWKEKSKFGLLIDCNLYKKGKIDRLFSNQLQTFGMKPSDVKWIVFDNWMVSNNDAKEIMKYVTLKYKDVPLMALSSMQERAFVENEFVTSSEYGFATLYMAPLQTYQVRTMVEAYNQMQVIAENDRVLGRLNADIENFNMHRTPLSCISLLEVFKRSFDDNPVNRTAMIQRLLSIIFDNEAVPTYKSLPDVKDCEFVLGYICEKIIRAEEYYFKEEDFYSAASTFCKEQKITLDYRYLFTILLNNQIICEYDSSWFGFRFSFWVYYFAAMRMTKSENFAAFILENKNYAHYPEVMEFYTGSDRTRNDAAQIVINDILEVTKKVEEKVGIPADVNPFQRLKINKQHDEQQVDRIIQQLDDNLQKSKLPDKIKDALVDRHYNPSRPFHQEVYKVMNNYSVNYLQEMIAIASKTMRNSDYIKPELKDQLFDSITDAWLNTIRVIYLMAPALAQQGVAGYDGFSLQLDEAFDKEGDSIQDKLIQIIASIPLNILNWYKDNIYTSKLAQLLYDKITDSSGPVIKHILIGIVINEQPEGWADIVQKYLTDVDRNSYYFGNTIDMLLSKWQFDSTMSVKNTVQTKNLILASYAKLYSNSNNFSLANVKRIKTSVLPERTKDEEEKR